MSRKYGDRVIPPLRNMCATRYVNCHANIHLFDYNTLNIHAPYEGSRQPQNYCFVILRLFFSWRYFLLSPARWAHPPYCACGIILLLRESQTDKIIKEEIPL